MKSTVGNCLKRIVEKLKEEGALFEEKVADFIVFDENYF